MFVKHIFYCDDQLPKAVCAKLFAPGTDEAKPAVSVSDKDRPKCCYSDGTNQSNGFIKAALKTCPKHCGLCCEAAKFDCKDNESKLQKDLRFCDEETTVPAQTTVGAVV
ncbi:unnamed protein product [Cylicocyclus nassatus]|uniref:ShKT domain-containing protein n=1 Tax=Cylicocyclus nassatus TaxID=53992 RepID=A0AA36M9W2_CYLNA|nr:unnamed protein product [Cylicocyclus nassatus]